MGSPSLARALGAALLVARCTGATAPTTPDDVPRATPCTAGMTIACPCPSGAQGAQTCDPSTGVFNACACPSPDGGADAPPTDTPPTDATPNDATTTDATTTDATTTDATTTDATSPLDTPSPSDAAPLDVVAADSRGDTGATGFDGPLDEPAVPDVASDLSTAPPQTYVYAITALTIDSAPGGAAPSPVSHPLGVTGFNLDGLFSGALGGSPADCAHGDFFSALDPDQDRGTCAPGVARGGPLCTGGVDNQLPEVATIFNGFGADLRMNADADIRLGRTAILLRVTNVNGTPGPTLDDPSVGVQVYPVARPLFASCAGIGGADLPYAVDDASLTTPGDLASARLAYAGRIVRGRLVVDPPADPTRAVFPLPLTVTTPLTVPLQAAQVRFSMTPERATGGNLGGYATFAALLSQVRAALPAGIPEATLATVLQSLVDVQLPAGSPAGCTAPGGGVSMGLGFTAVRAALAPTTVNGPVAGACGGPALPAGSCYTELAAAPVCPAVAVAQADATRPAYRVTHLRVTAPLALTSAILQNTVNDAIHRGNFLWGLSLDVPGRSIRSGALDPARVTRGAAGQGLFDGTFRYFAGDAPAPGAAARWDSATATLTGTAASATSGAFSAPLRLPIYDSVGAILTELPLEGVRFAAIRPAEGTRCVGLGATSGGRFNECTSAWTSADAALAPYGLVEGVLAVAASRAVRVAPLNTTLCNLLAGSDCDLVPQAMWLRQPDAMAGAAPGFRFSAEFAAISARIP